MSFPSTPFQPGGIIQWHAGKYFDLAKKEARLEAGWRWKDDKEEMELWAHIDSQQASLEELGRFEAWRYACEENEHDIKEGRPWVLRNCVKSAGWYWGLEPEEWEQLDWCINHYNDLCDEMEMADDMDAFREEMEQHRLCTTRVPSSSGHEWRISARSCGAQLGSDHEVSHTGRLSHPAMCYLVNTGPNYWTARMADGSGKVYIPLRLIPGYRWEPNTLKMMETGKCPLFVKVVFKGFPACRGRHLPWRAIHLE